MDRRDAEGEVEEVEEVVDEVFAAGVTTSMMTEDCFLRTGLCRSPVRNCCQDNGVSPGVFAVGFALM